MHDTTFDEKSDFYIIFSAKDNSEISVVEICPALSYELDDYRLASREHFPSRPEANTYAKELAAKHNITAKLEISQEELYLD